MRTGLRGWALAAMGYYEDGIAQMKKVSPCFARLGRIDYQVYYMCWLAEALLEMGRFDEGLRALTKALANGG